MAQGSGVKAIIKYDKVPRIEGAEFYIKQECIPGGTNRNYASYGMHVSPLTPEQKALLCDPQTSGGLLVAVTNESQNEFKAFASAQKMDITKIGHTQKQDGSYHIEVI